MISVLIVDDEYLIRKLILSAVDWERLGMRVIAEAADGVTALELIERHFPQLVILDINLPMKDGIEVSKLIAARYPDIKIIIVTGYDSFKYIQESMRAGVLDYVVKPIDAAELTLAVKKAKQLILQSGSFQGVSSSFSPSGTDFRSLTMAESAAALPSAALRVFSGEGLCRGVIIELDNYRHRSRKTGLLQNNLAAVLRVCDAYFYEAHATALCQTEQGRVHLLISDCGEEDRKQCPAIEALLERIMTDAGISVSIGLGTTVTAREAESSLFAAAKALSQKFFDGFGKVYGPDIQEQTYPASSQQFIDLSHIMHPLRNHNSGEVLDAIHRIYEKIAKNNLCKDYVFLVTAELINQAIRFSVEAGIDPQDSFFDRSLYLSHMEKCETIWDLELWISRLFYNIILFANQKRVSKPNQLAGLACAYIQEHYSDPELSLHTIAEHLFVNASYLSKLFKQALQTSVSEYVIETRMNLAKDLLDQTSGDKVATVAKRVGYTDPFYFSKSFKKWFGLSPSAYVDRGLSKATPPRR